MIWDLQTMSSVGKLEGHEQAVWSVLCLDDGGILTASADRSIKLWRTKTCVHTFLGHSDCVRSIALFPNVGFVSCGNDGSVRLWALSGECLMHKQVSESFLYGVAVLQTLEVVVVGEDKTCKVFRDGDVVCTLQHPGSVWSVGCTDEGDIITGCSDAIARVFTRSTVRRLPPSHACPYPLTFERAITIDAVLRSSDARPRELSGRAAQTRSETSALASAVVCLAADRLLRAARRSVRQTRRRRRRTRRGCRARRCRRRSWGG